MSVVDNPPQKQKESTTDNETNNIVFSLKECSFKYPNTERTVLNNISLDIHRGEIVSIVGCNGSGKSTLVKILCGLYEPTSGSIELNGKPMSQYSQQDISENITAIFQDFMLYNTSAHDNIWYGNLSEDSDIERIQLATQKSGIAPVFEKLKDGYDTALGNLFPNSEMLSQGEWQRTALARSFYSKARIIILDEPTSSLDAFTEASLIDNFRDITQGRTAIIISHRLSTIRMADRIIVLNNKKIAEIGTFDELMSQQGFLFSMVENLNK
jgi:ATP-binding cassette subfamily B protein